MFSTLFSITVAVSLAVKGVLADFTIETPANFTQCDSVPISWNGGIGPYNLAIVPADDQCGPITADLGDHNVTHIHYTVNLAAGSQVVLSLLDSNDNEAWSNTIPVVSGGNTSCLSSDIIASEASLSSTVVASTATSPPITPTTLIVPPNAVAPEAAPSSSSLPSAGAATPQGASGSGLLSGGATTISSASFVTLIIGFAAFIFTITL